MIVFSEHALERMDERGASKAEVREVIRQGESFDVRQDRIGFRLNFLFREKWNNTWYENKEVTVFAVQEVGDWIVVTVVTRYY